jgi:hypothetical protein
MDEQRAAAGIRFEAADIDVRGHVLSRLSEELGRIGRPHIADSHIKNKCDIHGKGDHIKGAGPNYLKSKSVFDPSDAIINPQIEQLIERVAERVAAKLQLQMRG